jgi:hypothetical protein
LQRYSYHFGRSKGFSKATSGRLEISPAGARARQTEFGASRRSSHGPGDTMAEEDIEKRSQKIRMATES